MAANTPSASAAAADLENDAKAKAQADADAVEAKAKADAEADEKSSENEIEKVWVAVKSFTARHLTQLLHFDKGDEIAHDVGSALAATGSPVRPVDPEA
jgi:hypothetical protein